MNLAVAGPSLSMAALSTSCGHIDMMGDTASVSETAGGNGFPSARGNSKGSNDKSRHNRGHRFGIVSLSFVGLIVVSFVARRMKRNSSLPENIGDALSVPSAVFV